MTTIMRDKVLNLASRQVGYREEYINCTKYSRYFDVEAWQWFNTKKNGNPAKKVAGTEWCAILICWLFCQNEILGPKKARTFLGCPIPKNNCAAGVPYLWDYLKARKWQVDKKSGVAGVIFFFNTSKEKCGHVGIIESVDAKAYHTIEGNKCNQVKRCTYTKTSTKIYGIMRPAWSEIEPKEEKPIETTPDKPEPVTPTYPKYKVSTKTGEWLALRVAPKLKAVLIVRMDNGSTVELIQTVKGDVFSGSNQWAQVRYTKNGRAYIGYCIKSRLKAI